jgi:hypothetical protein
MAFDYELLAEMSQITTTTGILYTHSTGSKSYVRTFMMHNSSDASIDVELYKVPDNGGAVGVASTANRFYKDSIVSEDTVFIEIPVPGMLMTGTNDTIQGYTSASGINYEIYGGRE